MIWMVFLVIVIGLINLTYALYVKGKFGSFTWPNKTQTPIKSTSDSTLVGDPTDWQIVFALSELAAKQTFAPDAFYDVSVLPHSKERILRAFENLLRQQSDDSMFEWLRLGTVTTQLSHFQPGIGNTPVYIFGFPMSSAPTTISVDEARKEIAQIVKAGQKSKALMEIAQREDLIIQNRIDSAVRSRNARFNRIVDSSANPHLRPELPKQHDKPTIAEDEMEISQLRDEAENGNHEAQYYLACEYMDGEANQSNLVEAYKWFTIHWNSPRPRVFISPSADELRSELRKRMSKSEIARANKLARDWLSLRSNQYEG